jgi:hypothetical protein
MSIQQGRQTNTPPGEQERVIRASEVGAYAYCAHAWWLGGVEGVRSQNRPHLRAGRAAHERHGRQVLIGAFLTRLAYLLLLLAGLAGVGWVISSLLG